MSANPNVRVVSFRKDEQNLLEHVEGKYFSAYVKELIKKDMQEGERQERTPQRRNINFKGL